MPFKSEKQRRFLWAAHPDIAKRWAHEYPESNKGLPMYAKKKKTQKEAMLGGTPQILGRGLRKAVGNFTQTGYAKPVSAEQQPALQAQQAEALQRANNAHNWRPPVQPQFPRPQLRFGPLDDWRKKRIEPGFQEKFDAWRTYDNAMLSRPVGSLKFAALTAISGYVNKLNNLQINVTRPETGGVAKKANSKQEYIEIPRSEKPTYAGEEREQNVSAGQDFDMSSSGDNKPKKRENAINSLLQKISVVIGPKLRKAKEKQDAALEGRPEEYVPDNLGNKRYPAATPGIMPPIGMQPQQAQPQPQQPQSRPSAPPVGNGSTPQSRPIQSFGGLDVNNKLTGNSGLANGRASGANIKTSQDLLRLLRQSPYGQSR
jgi:hypothetical protein